MDGDDCYKTCSILYILESKVENLQKELAKYKSDCRWDGEDAGEYVCERRVKQDHENKRQEEPMEDTSAGC